MTSQSLVNKFNTCKDPRAQVWRLSHTRGDSPPPYGGSQGIRGGGGLAWMKKSRYLLVLTPGNANRK